MTGARRGEGLERLWRARDATAGERFARAALAPAEAAFRLAAGVRGRLYDAGVLPVAHAGIPVISVGNLAVGGAGKTPVAMAIAGRLLAAGRRPALLSRGYGAVRNDPRVISDGERVLLDAAGGGDEPVLAARRLPGLRVLCGPDRAALVPRARALGADVLLLDDGFQHRRLARDLDVVVLDAGDPWGNGHCLPRGPNREPREALARAGLAWLGHVDRASEHDLADLRALALRLTGRPPVESRHAPRALVDGLLGQAFPLEDLRGALVGLLTGVASPGSVRRTVEALGARVVASADFPDHHRFTGPEVEDALARASAAGARLVVTTEKDAVRLPPDLAGDARIRALRVEAEVLRGEAELAAALDAALGGKA